MPRSALTKTVLSGSYPGTGVAVVWQDSDPVNGNTFAASGKEMILVRNTGATAKQITLQANADPFGRVSDVVESIASAAMKAYGPFQLLGWATASGNFEIDSDSTDLEVAVLVLP